MRRLCTKYLVVTTAIVLQAAAPADLRAQEGLTLDVYGGLATYGRLLEQYVLGGQREVTAASSGIFGAAIGMQPWDAAGIRLGATWAPTEIQFENDTGLGADIPGIDDDEVADLTATVVSLEATAAVLGEVGMFRPYTIVGVAGGWWSLDDDEGVGAIATGDEESQFGFGGTGGLGLEMRPHDRFVVRLEAAQFRLGNPFNGNDGWTTTSGVTFDEPDSVRLSRYTLGVGFVLGDD